MGQVVGSNISYRKARRGWLLRSLPGFEMELILRPSSNSASHSSSSSNSHSSSSSSSYSDVKVGLDVLIGVLKYLSPKDRLKASLTCRIFRMALEQEILWENQPPSNMKYLYWQPNIACSQLLKGKDDDALAKTIGKRLTTDGFLIVSLDTSEEIISIHKILQDFFSSRKYHRDNFPAKDHGKTDYREYFHISSKAKTSPYPWKGANSETAATVEKYHNLVKSIAAKIFYYTMKFMNTPENYLKFIGDNEGDDVGFLRLMIYPGAPESNTLSHKDLGIFAVVPCSNLGTGLNFYYPKGKPVEIETTIGANDLLVFPGLLLHEITGKKIEAMTHSVQQQNNDRYNMVYQLRAKPTVTLPSKKTVQNFISEAEMRETQNYRKMEDINIASEPLYQAN